MHPLRCPYRGKALALRASRGVHNKCLSICKLALSFFANNFEIYHLLGTIFLISQDFSILEGNVFCCIFNKHLILLSASHVTRNDTLEKSHKKMWLWALKSFYFKMWSRFLCLFSNHLIVQRKQSRKTINEKFWNYFPHFTRFPNRGAHFFCIISKCLIVLIKGVKFSKG